MEGFQSRTGSSSAPVYQLAPSTFFKVFVKRHPGCMAEDDNVTLGRALHDGQILCGDMS